MASGLETAHRKRNAAQVAQRLPSSVADALPVLIRHSDLLGHCTFANRQWLSLTGRRLDQELEDGWAESIHPDDRAGCLEVLKDACKAQEAVSIEYRLRHRDGAWRWLHEQAAPLAGAGAPQGLLHAAFDVSEHRLGVERLQRLVDQQQVLLAELRHRAVNRAQLILSLLRVQAREAADDVVRAALEAAATRVQALALAEQTLGSVPDGASPRLSDCLQELATALQPRFDQRSIVLDLRADDSEVPTRVAMPLGLLVNELLMNTLRHAFPEGRSGTVKLVGTKAGDHLKILVADDGVGLPANLAPHRARSGGMWLIDSLAKQIGAEVRVERDRGTCFVLTVPIG